MSKTKVIYDEQGWPYFSLDSSIGHDKESRDDFVAWVDTVESKINQLVSKMDTYSIVVNNNARGDQSTSNRSMDQRLSDLEERVDIENDSAYCCPECDAVHVLSTIDQSNISYKCSTCNNWSNKHRWLKVLSEKAYKIQKIRKQLSLLENELNTIDYSNPEVHTPGSDW